MTKTKWRTLAFVSVILIIHAASVSCTHSRVKESSKGNFTKSLPHNGLKRTYHLHIPSSYRESIAAPLVVALHGGGGNGNKMAQLSGLSLLSDENGFIVVYPDAVERHWNDGRGLSKYRN